MAALTAGLLFFAHRAGVTHKASVMALLLAVPAILAFSQVERPARFGLALLGIVVALWGDWGAARRVLHKERTFFGIHSVVLDEGNGTHRLFHGTTIHGMQRLDPAGRREPLTYYHRTGPVGQLLSAARPAEGRRVAVVGLGAGSLAAYMGRGDRLTFFEIDPAVRRIAEDPAYFTFLRDARARGVDLRVVLGDARLTLREAPDAAYDLLVLDAFSSDSIATHLLTREAFHLYRHKLTPGGRLAFHLSNRYLDLRGVVGALAADAGLTCLFQADFEVSAQTPGKFPSEWAVMAPDATALAPLRRDPRWQPVPPSPGTRVWTDDYSNILSVLVWR